MVSKDNKIKQETIVNHLKNYGFVYNSSEIYNGFANAWDYGPLGTLLKKNLKDLWWKEFVTKQKNVVGLDSMILLNPIVWEASGHLKNFSDPLIDCRQCKSRFRADKLVETIDSNIVVSEKTQNDEIKKIFSDLKITCPNCKAFDWTDIRQFNLMFKTHQGVIEDNKTQVYLRPETAQGIFINFKNILRTSRQKIPFGIAQIGKSFRNEITPGNFIFRTREFEQMELEFFCHEDEAYDWFDKYLKKIKNFLINLCSIDKNLLIEHEHDKEQLSHYSKKTIDYNFKFPHGESELWGLAYRTDYDLKVHAEYSKKELDYLDPITQQKYYPHVIEPSVGVERLLYAICCSVYDEENLEDDIRVVLRLPYVLSPYKVCILPLLNKLKDEATKIYEDILNAGISCNYDASGSIGKRYRRQDAIGTYYCITVDFDTEQKNTVTIRNRDTMEQTVIKKDEILSFLEKNN